MRFVTLSLVGFSLALAACQKPQSGSSPSPQPGAPIARGMGGVCPNLQGSYECSLIPGERPKGQKTHRLLIQNKRNEQGRPMISIAEGDITKSFISTGDVVSVPELGVFYSVDCNGQQVAIHENMRSKDGNLDQLAKYALAGRSSLMMNVTLTADGKTINYSRRCNRISKR